MQDTKLFRYIERVGIALSVLLNVLLGGYSNQTFSARNYDWKKRNRPNIVFIIDFIFLFLFGQRDHCMSSWINWKLIRQGLYSNVNRGEYLNEREI